MVKQKRGRKSKTKRPKKTKVNYRPATFTLIVGTNGTGKTTQLLKLLEKQAKKRKVFIVDSFSMDEKTRNFKEINVSDKALIDSLENGIYRINITRFETKTWYFIWAFIHDALIVFDDATSTWESKLLKYQKKLLNNRRHKDLDLFFVVHGFRTVPPALVDVFTHLAVFKTAKTGALTSTQKSKMVNFDKVQAAIDKVNKNASPYYYKFVRLR